MAERKAIKAANNKGKIPRHPVKLPKEEVEHLMRRFQPLNDWLSRMSTRWDRKYAGKYLGIIEVGDCQFKLAFVTDSEEEAFRRFEEEFPDQIPTVCYQATKKELEMVL